MACTVTGIVTTLSPLEAQAQTTWTAGGATDFQWSNSANWSTALEPTSADAVIFPTPIPNPGSLVSPEGILVSIGELANSLTFNAAYSLSGGDLTLAGGTITVASGIQAGISSVLKGTNLTKNGPGTLNLFAANAYTGVMNVDEGVVNVSGDQTGATGGWSLKGRNFAQTPAENRFVTTVNFLSGSTVSVASGKSIIIGNTSANGGFSSQTLNAAGTVTNSGTLQIGRSGNLNINNGANWTQSGTASVTAQGGGTATMNVNSGGTFTYTNASTFNIVTSSAAGTLNVNGGTFVTGSSLRNNHATLAAVLTLNNGGTLRISNNSVTSLLTTAGGAFNLQLGTNGGVIDTQAFSTEVVVPIVNMSGQTGAFTKKGAGTLTLSGANTYTGITTVNEGTLLLNGAISGTAEVKVLNGGILGLGANDVLNNAAALTLTGGTFSTNGFDDAVSTLTLGVGLSTINLGSGSSVLTLADSSGLAWAGTLSILNWSGSQLGGGTDQLFFGTTASGLTAEQVNAIQFVDPEGLPSGTYAAQMLTTGELVAVPEPSSIAILAGGLGCLLGVRRRRDSRAS